MAGPLHGTNADGHDRNADRTIKENQDWNR
jgi:hypothetical protein